MLMFIAARKPACQLDFRLRRFRRQRGKPEEMGQMPNRSARFFALYSSKDHCPSVLAFAAAPPGRRTVPGLQLHSKGGFLHRLRIDGAKQRAYKTGQRAFQEVQPCTLEPPPTPLQTSHTSSMSCTRRARTAASSLTSRRPPFIPTALRAATAVPAAPRCLKPAWRIRRRQSCSTLRSRSCCVRDGSVCVSGRRPTLHLPSFAAPWLINWGGCRRVGMRDG